MYFFNRRQSQSKHWGPKAAVLGMATSMACIPLARLPNDNVYMAGLFVEYTSPIPSVFDHLIKQQGVVGVWANRPTKRLPGSLVGL